MYQVELNRTVESPEYSFTDAYAYYIVMTFVTCIYGYIVPWITPLLIVWFILQYWLDKYNLFKRFSTPIEFSFQFVELLLCIFEVSILFFAVSHFLWDLNIHADSSVGYRVVNILSMVLAFLYVLLVFISPESFKKRVLDKYSKCDIFSYSNYMAFKSNKFSKTFYT
jgi:flagellar biosynthesis protein FlhB